MKYRAIYPILGFENEKEYELSHIEGPFYKLEGKDVSFTLIDPFVLRDDYNFELDDEFTKNLKLNENNVLVLNILIPQKPFEESTVNFAAPLIFNVEDKVFGQAILDKYNYSLSRPLKDFLGEKNEN